MGAREKILAAADQLFGEVGFDVASTREIAERAGVNKAMLYYHFKGKDELLEALLDDYYERMTGMLSAMLTDGDGVEDRVAVLVDAYVDFLVEHRNFSRIVQREVVSGRHIERVTRLTMPVFRTGTKLLQAAFPKTRGGPWEASQVLVSFYGVVIAYFGFADVIAGLTGADPLAPEAIAARKAHLRQMVSLVLGSLREA